MPSVCWAPKETMMWSWFHIPCEPLLDLFDLTPPDGRCTSLAPALYGSRKWAEVRWGNSHICAHFYGTLSCLVKHLESQEWNGLRSHYFPSCTPCLSSGCCSTFISSINSSLVLHLDSVNMEMISLSLLFDLSWYFSLLCLHHLLLPTWLLSCPRFIPQQCYVFSELSFHALLDLQYLTQFRAQ